MFSVSPFVFVIALPRSPAPRDVSFVQPVIRPIIPSAQLAFLTGMAWHLGVRQQHTQRIRPDAVAEDDGRAMDEDKSEKEQIEYGPPSY